MKKIFPLSVIAAGSLLICFSDAAQAAGTYNAVRDERQAFVRSRSGECVRTHWQTPTDLCRQPEPKPLMAAIPVFRTRFHEDTRTVHFNFDDDTLTPAAMYKLDKLADTLKYSKDIRRAEIIGQADKMGSEGYNMQLSGRRARAVENYLNSRGYWNTSVTLVRGIGSSAAIMDCSQFDTHAQRVQCNGEDRKAVVNVVYGMQEQVDPTFRVDPTF